MARGDDRVSTLCPQGGKVLRLSVIRIIAVFLSLLGSGRDSSIKLLVGWFGPSTLASVAFAVIDFDAVCPVTNPGGDGGLHPAAQYRSTGSQRGSAHRNLTAKSH